MPFADGGEASTANIELRCRAHNAYEAELSFGSFVLRERQAEYNSVRTELEPGHEIGAARRTGRCYRLAQKRFSP